jgi:hypothetical protein
MPTINWMSKIPVDPDQNRWQSIENSSNPDIDTVGAIALRNLLGSDGTFEIFALNIGEYCGLPSAKCILVAGSLQKCLRGCEV